MSVRKPCLAESKVPRSTSQTLIKIIIFLLQWSSPMELYAPVIPQNKTWASCPCAPKSCFQKALRLIRMYASVQVLSQYHLVRSACLHRIRFFFFNFVIQSIFLLGKYNIYVMFSLTILQILPFFPDVIEKEESVRFIPIILSQQRVNKTISWLYSWFCNNTSYEMSDEKFKHK